MKGSHSMTRCILCLLLAACCAAAAAENAGDPAEQGLEEIRPLIEMTEVDETEGMSLEEMTEAYTENAMAEYYDGITGFSMQYPSVFQFDESGNGNTAATTDGKATLTIDNMPNQGGLDEKALLEAVRMETPGIEPRKNEQNGCLRFDRTTEDGKTTQTDLYLITEKSFHHVTLRYPTEENGTYDTYIEYMINTMGTAGTDLG